MPSRYQEHDEQVAFFRKIDRVPWNGETLRDYCFAVPNGGTNGGRRALLAGVRRKAEGVSSGVPDVECVISSRGYTGLHIEFKRADGVPSDVSTAQREWLDRLRKCGRKAEVAFGAEQAWRIITEYLKLEVK
jgi:hypothetical protein